MDAYLGEIRMFAGDFAPQGWLSCDGSLQSISTYQALFSLIGTTYGGDGTRTFALPDLRGRIPVGQGQGPGLSQRVIGGNGGVETVALGLSETLSHTHGVSVTTVEATTVTPGPTVNLAATTAPAANYLVTLPSPTVPRVLDDSTVGVSGGDPSGVTVPHGNFMPSFAVTFIICMAGLFPVRQ